MACANAPVTEFFTALGQRGLAVPRAVSGDQRRARAERAGVTVVQLPKRIFLDFSSPSSLLPRRPRAFGRAVKLHADYPTRTTTEQPLEHHSV